LIPNEQNAEWDQTLANGQTVNGHCLSGYSGSISRPCTQSGSNGNWGIISGTCNGISFFFIVYLFTYLFFSINNIK